MKRLLVIMAALILVGCGEERSPNWQRAGIFERVEFVGTEPSGTTVIYFRGGQLFMPYFHEVNCLPGDSITLWGYYDQYERHMFEGMRVIRTAGEAR